MTGLKATLEPRIRRLVADILGVEPEALAPEASLADDLAADSLDLVEIALGLEAEFDVRVPERVLDDVRTYAELVQAMLALTRVRRHEMRHEAEPLRVCARVIPNPRAGDAVFERVGWLTPYTTETILEDALHAGRGSRLVVTVPWDVSAAGLARVQRSFARLTTRGVDVCVRRATQMHALTGPDAGEAAA